MTQIEAAQPTPKLLKLPAEILRQVFTDVLPIDLASLQHVCRELRTFVKGNVTLFRDVYLNHLDTPPDVTGVDWIRELQDVVRLEKVCDSENRKEHEFDFVYDTTTRLLKRASSTGDRLPPLKSDPTVASTVNTSRNARLLKRFFDQEGNAEAFLIRSAIYDGAIRRRLPSSPSMRQRSAHLHCLQESSFIPSCLPDQSYAHACSKVYDLRGYTEDTKWGPFLDFPTGEGENNEGPKVDWEKVEAILLTLRMNLLRRKFMNPFRYLWENPFAGTWAGSYLAPGPKANPTSLELEDPYGITGTWCRVSFATVHRERKGEDADEEQIVCFMDYNDFFSFNFPMRDLTPDHQPRRPIDVGEAVRLIAMHLTVEKIEPPGPEDGQDYPVVHFKGTSRALEHAWPDDGVSGIRGTVRQTKEGEIWWTSVSIFQEVERWKSECIQLGGIRSARGVVGNWFDRDYDPHGPAGPTSFWKVSDEHLERNIIRRHLPHSTSVIAFGLGLEVGNDDDLYESTQDENSMDEVDEDGDDLQEEMTALLHDAEVPLEEVVPQLHSQTGDS